MSIKTVTKNVLGRELSEHNKQLGLSTLAKAKETNDNLLHGLLNKMDNNYIQTEGEGNVIDLPNSGDGLAIVDSIEGNTLINHYDSSTLTPTIGGIILQNEGFKLSVLEGMTGTWSFNNYKKPPYKDQTDYTFILYVSKNTFPKEKTDLFRVFRPENTNGIGYYVPGGLTGIVRCKIRTDKSKTTDWYSNITNFAFNLSAPGELIVSNIMLLEGDWTDRKLPQYFKGMKSFGECEGNVIDIYCRNENLIEMNKIKSGTFNALKIENNSNKELLLTPTRDADSYGHTTLRMFLDRDQQYTFSGTTTAVGGWGTVGHSTETYYLKDGRYDLIYYGASDNPKTFLCRDSGWYTFRVDANSNLVARIMNLKLESGTTATPYKEALSNKISFTLKEPLRAVPNTKDKIVIKDNKLMVERNVGKAIIDGENLEYSHFDFTGIHTVRFGVIYGLACDGIWDGDFGEQSMLCDYLGYRQNYNPDEIGFYKDRGIKDGKLIMRIRKNGITDINMLKQNLKSNPLTFLYKLDKPVYEEITDIPKLTLTSYQRATLLVNSIIPPSKVLVRYSPFAPVLAEARSNIMTNETIKYDINGYIVPQFMDMEFKLLELEKKLGDKLGNITMKANLTVEEVQDIMTSQERTFEMLKRDISSKRLTYDQAVTRVTAYSDANRITKEHEQELLLLASEQLK